MTTPPTTRPNHTDGDRISALQQELSELRAELVAMRHREGPPVARGSTAPTGDERTSRRQVLRRGVLAAGAGVAAGGLAVVRPAAAADTGPLLIGADNAGTNTTTLTNAGTTFAAHTTSTVALDAAIKGTSASTSAQVAGVFGTAAEAGSSAGVRGEGPIGGHFRGSLAALFLESDEGPPTASALAHLAGEVYVDTNNELWFCVAEGTPGTWRKLAGPGTAGALHPVTPFRAYDSRFADGRLSNELNRLVSLKDAIDLNTGAVTQANALPAGATGVMFNFTCTGTVAGGFLAVTPGDASAFAVSTINWSASGQTFANATFVKLGGDRQVKVFAGGSGAASNFIIDITGYTL